MPENHIPATQPEPGAEPGEFNFSNPAKENPRIKRRSLKAKPEGLVKPAATTLSAARELEREAPPLSAERAQTVKPLTQETAAAKVAPAAKSTQAPTAPPRTTPSSATTQSEPVSGGSFSPKTTAYPASTPSPTASPHGTRPAALYYSSPRKDKAAEPSPMKTIPTAGPAPSSSSSTLPSSVTRPAAASAAPRPASSIDYRANVERQSREQKSVGNILAYAVYALIGFFVLGAGLAAYGADVIFKQIHDQSVTVSDLDARYAEANKELTAKLTTTEDTLNQAQAQIARQQDLILKQQEELNRLIVATNDTIAALKQEKQSRTQDTSSLRAQIRDVENRGTYQH